MTNKQLKFVLDGILGHCCCAGYNVHPRDKTKFCVVGAFMTPENRQRVIDEGLMGAGFDGLPHDIQDQIMRDTGLDDSQLNELQGANDDVEGNWAKRKVIKRQKSVLEKFEEFEVASKADIDRLVLRKKK